MMSTITTTIVDNEENKKTWLVAPQSHLSGSTFGLFAPKFWEVVGTNEWWFYSKMNTASVVVTLKSY